MSTKESYTHPRDTKSPRTEKLRIGVPDRETEFIKKAFQSGYRIHRRGSPKLFISIVEDGKRKVIAVWIRRAGKTKDGKPKNLTYHQRFAVMIFNQAGIPTLVF